MLVVFDYPQCRPKDPVYRLLKLLNQLKKKTKFEIETQMCFVDLSIFDYCSLIGY